MGKRCERCTTQRRAATDAVRGTSTERGYDASWRRIRLSALRRDAYRCVQCGWIPDVVATYDHIGIDVLPEEALILDELRRRKLANKRHLHVDHIETVESKPELRLTLGNLQVLCSRCHSHKTAKEDGGFGRR
jgi:5-methylcytosine-specific restriction endonuclease McrA